MHYVYGGIRYCIKDNNYIDMYVFDFAFANVLRGALHLAAILFSSLLCPSLFDGIVYIVRIVEFDIATMVDTIFECEAHRMTFKRQQMSRERKGESR